MKLFLLCLLAATLSVAAQPSPYRLLQPIMKNPNQRNAPSSVGSADLGPGPSAPSQDPKIILVQPQKPAEIVAKIDPGWAASKITIMARITGIKGTLYVTNLLGAAGTPHVQLAVCDRNGFKIGTAAKVGEPLAAAENERIDIVATNAGSVDLKLMTLSGKGD
jgi:hypothetical protein